jgi:hypothetical protein
VSEHVYASSSALRDALLPSADLISWRAQRNIFTSLLPLYSYSSLVASGAEESTPAGRDGQAGDPSSETRGVIGRVGIEARRHRA